MNNAVINIKTEISTKKQAQKIAAEFGFSLSSLINSYLKEIVRTRKLNLDLGEAPSPYLTKQMKLSEKNYREGRVSPTFKTGEEAIKWLDDPDARLENGDKA